MTAFQAELKQALKKIAEVNMKKAFREALNAAETLASDENGFCACQDGVHEDADAVHEAVLKAQDQKSSYFCLMKKLILLLLLFAFPVPLHASPSSSAFASDSGSDTDYSSEWKILTKHNFSTQIRIHPHILLLVTLPWSGESRALMKDVAQAVDHWKHEFSSLKLMFMYRNTEKVLADAIGARGETTILYFHHYKSYKYQGRLRAQNILSSVHPHLIVPPDDVPLKRLNSPQELRAFLDSTDKAFLLLEFCGWTPKLQHREKNATEQGFGVQGGSALGGNAFPTSPVGNDDQKWTDSSMQCSIGSNLNGIPWLGEFGSVSDAVSWNSKESGLDTGYSCNFQEFPLFESFFSTFMTVARELFLPPERHRFGLVVQRSLLSSLGVEEPISWSVMVHYAGCPSCSKMLKEVDDFKSFMQTDNSIVAELEASGHTEKLVLPANKPSMLLFVDRSSELPEDRVKSMEALDALRELAWYSQFSNHVPGEKPGNLGWISFLSHQQQRSSFRHSNLKPSESSHIVKAKTKMSSMSINDGKEKRVSLDTDLNKNALHEILEYLLQQKNEGKLSLLAKKVGFQLLSNDFEVKIASTSLKTGDQPIQGSLEFSQEDLRSIIHQDEKQLLHDPAASSAWDGDMHSTGDEKLSKLRDPKPSQYDQERRSKNMVYEESGHLTAMRGLVNSKDFIPEKRYLLKVDELREELQIEGFDGTFHFSDGDYRLLRTLTGDSKIPSLVIIDPIRQQHYIYPDQKNFSFDAQAQFLRDYINVSILPYQHAEPVLPISREASRPPFVNLDFHEADSIPKITARTLAELISGVNHSWGESVPPHWQKDVFVLFSGNWCGFCQRMELVVREVYRALKGHVNMLKTRFQYEELSPSGDRLQDVSLKLPVIYLLDCTFNDCSHIFKTMNKGELYPSLVLFPAGNESPVTYEGETAVSSVINFMVEHGSNLRHLISENGILWTQTEKGGGGKTYFEDRIADAVDLAIPTVEDRFREILTDEIPEKISRDTHGGESYDSKSVEKLEAAPDVVVGSILVATEKLVGAYPFGGSMILILKAERETGFQGVIFNKHISWDSLGEMEEGSEVLREAKLSLGGPLAMRGFPLTALTRRSIKRQLVEVLPGIYFVDQLGTVGVIDELKSGATQPVTDYWFFLGYASWGWDQLFDEIAEGAWTVSRDDSTELLEWPSR